MCVIACSSVHSFFFFKDLLIYFSFVLAKLHGMWDITSLIRDRNCIPCSGVLTTGPPREVPTSFILNTATSQPWHCWYLASTRLAPRPHVQCDTQKRHQARPTVPWEHNRDPSENHCCAGLVPGQLGPFSKLAPELRTVLMLLKGR